MYESEGLRIKAMQMPTWFQLLIQLILICFRFLFGILLVFRALFVNPVARQKASGIVRVAEWPNNVRYEGLLQLGQLG